MKIEKCKYAHYFALTVDSTYEISDAQFILWLKMQRPMKNVLCSQNSIHKAHY